MDCILSSSATEKKSLIRILVWQRREYPADNIFYLTAKHSPQTTGRWNFFMSNKNKCATFVLNLFCGTNYRLHHIHNKCISYIQGHTYEHTSTRHIKFQSGGSPRL